MHFSRKEQQRRSFEIPRGFKPRPHQQLTNKRRFIASDTVGALPSKSTWSGPLKRHIRPKATYSQERFHHIPSVTLVHPRHGRTYPSTNPERRWYQTVHKFAFLLKPSLCPSQAMLDTTFIQLIVSLEHHLSLAVDRWLEQAPPGKRCT